MQGIIPFLEQRHYNEGRLKEYYLYHDGTYLDALLYGIINENN